MKAAVGIRQSAAWVAQANDASAVASTTRDDLIVAEVMVGESWVIQSQYKHDRWVLNGVPTNAPEGARFLDFTKVPARFRLVAKETIYRYMRRGVNGSGRPAASTVRAFLTMLLDFFHYLAAHDIERLSDVTPLVCTGYVVTVKAKRSGRGNTPLAKGSLLRRFRAVESLFKLGAYTSDPMCDPWPDSAAVELAGTRRRHGACTTYRTPLIPDEIFAKIFQRAWSIVQDAPRLLDLCDKVEAVGRENEHFEYQTVQKRQHKCLVEEGWTSGLHRLYEDVHQVRTACYVVVASLSGCRNHEILNLRASSWYSSEDDDGVRYWWMRSRSQKTDEGLTEWLIPEAAVEALKVMDRWSAPHRKRLELCIDEMRRANPVDPAIAKALTHSGAVFLAYRGARTNQPVTMNSTETFKDLGAFAKFCGVEWALSSHQFRRKFAEYAARSQYGDLRYLRVHFKHWSMDMALAYALNEKQDYSLYFEVQDEWDDLKAGAVDQWLDPAVPLAGGYGRRLMEWRVDDGITLFKSRKDMVLSIAQSTAIRSNGHAWCTADDNKCIGNDLDRTRCGAGCENAVIGEKHASIYQGLYDALHEVLKCDDIGPGGVARVTRDLERCRTVLVQLGHDPGSGASPTSAVTS